MKSRGIEDISKIKYEDEDGQEEEIDWDTLGSSEKLNILNQLNSGSDNDLDDSELQLINAIRGSKMSPAEYLNYIALVYFVLQDTIRIVYSHLPSFYIHYG